MLDSLAQQAPTSSSAGQTSEGHQSPRTRLRLTVRRSAVVLLALAALAFFAWAGVLLAPNSAHRHVYLEISAASTQQQQPVASSSVAASKHLLRSAAGKHPPATDVSRLVLMDVSFRVSFVEELTAAQQPADTALLTHASGTYLAQYSTCVIINALYALRHRYGFILDQHDYLARTDFQFLSAKMNKVLSIQKHIASYAWLVWLDADVVVTQPAVPMSSFLADNKRGPVNLVMSDHSDNVNNNTNLPITAVEPMDRPLICTQDQSAMYAAILEHLRDSLGPSIPCAYNGELDDPVTRITNQFTANFWNEHLSCNGFPYGQREDMPYIRLLSPANRTSDRGFNKWFRPERLGWTHEHRVWAPEDWWAPGDFMAHTKYPEEIIMEDYLTDLMTNSLTNDTLQALLDRIPAEVEAAAKAAVAAGGQAHELGQIQLHQEHRERKERHTQQKQSTRQGTFGTYRRAGHGRLGFGAAVADASWATQQQQQQRQQQQQKQGQDNTLLQSLIAAAASQQGHSAAPVEYTPVFNHATGTIEVVRVLPQVLQAAVARQQQQAQQAAHNQ